MRNSVTEGVGIMGHRGKRRGARGSNVWAVAAGSVGFGALAGLLLATAGACSDEPSGEAPSGGGSGGSDAGPRDAAPGEERDADGGPKYDPDAAAGPCENTAANPRHCGRCDHSCFGGTCVEGICQPTVLARAMVGPHQITIAGESLLVSDSVNDEIVRIDKNSGKTSSLTRSSESPLGIARDGDRVFFTDFIDSDAGAVKFAYLDGGATTAVSTRANGPFRIVVDERYAYWSEVTGRSIHRWPKDGSGNIETVAAFDGGAPKHLARSGGALFFGVDGLGIYRCSEASCLDSFGPIASTPDVSCIAADETAVYFAQNSGDATIRSLPRDGGTATTLARGQARPIALAVDGESIYWINRGPPDNALQYPKGSLVRCAKSDCNGTVRVLADGLPEARDLAVDTDAVYATTFGIGNEHGYVIKVAKP